MQDSAKGYAESDMSLDLGSDSRGGGGGQAVRGMLNSCDPLSTLSVTTTNRPSMPKVDAASVKRKDYLEYQLDTMHGKELLGGLRFLSGLDKRLNGGACPSLLRDHLEFMEQCLVKLMCRCSCNVVAV